MSTAMCPRCRRVRNIAVTTSTRTAVGVDGQERTIRTTSYHCEVCHHFVRSEDTPEPPAGRSNA